MINLEEKILNALEFDFEWSTPLDFIARFQRLFGLDRIREDKHSYVVDASATFLCRFMMRDAKFLDFKPSHIAVAAFVMALNANLKTPLSKLLEAEILPRENINMESFYQERTIKI